MSFRVSGKNIDVGEALRERISARVAEALGKFFDGGYSGHATIGKDGFGFRTECALHLDSGITLHADGQAADPYDSADQAAIRMEKRLRRYHGRLKKHHTRHNNYRVVESGPAIAAPSFMRTKFERWLNLATLTDFWQSMSKRAITRLPIFA